MVGNSSRQETKVKNTTCCVGKSGAGQGDREEWARRALLTDSQRHEGSQGLSAWMCGNSTEGIAGCRVDGAECGNVGLRALKDLSLNSVGNGETLTCDDQLTSSGLSTKN